MYLGKKKINKSKYRKNNEKVKYIRIQTVLNAKSI